MKQIASISSDLWVIWGNIVDVLLARCQSWGREKNLPEFYEETK